MRKKIELTVRAWVHKDGRLVNVDTLPPEDRVELATQLKVTWLNTLYQGRAVFTAATDTKEDRTYETAAVQTTPGGGDG